MGEIICEQFGEPGDQRLAILEVTDSLLAGLVRSVSLQSSYRIEVVKNAVPESARIVSVRYNERLGHFGIVLEDESFEPIREGSMIPYLPRPMLRIIYEKEESP